MADNTLAWLPSDIQATLQDEVRSAALYARPRVGEPISSTTLDAWHRAGLAHAQQKGLVFTASSLALALKVRGVTPLSLSPALAYYRKTGALVTVSEVAAKRAEAEKGRVAKAAGWALWAATSAPRALLRVGTTLGTWASDSSAYSESGGLDDDDASSSELGIDEHEPMIWLSAAEDACAVLTQHVQSLDPVSRAVALPVDANLTSLSDSDDPVTFGQMSDAAGLGVLSLQAQTVLVDLLVVSGRVRVTEADSNTMKDIAASPPPSQRGNGGIVQWHAVRFLLDSVVDGDSSSSGSSDVVLVRARLAAAELAHQIAAEEVAWFGSSVLSSLDRETTSHGQSASEPAEAGSGTPAVRVSPSRSIGKRHAMMAAALQERKRGNKSGCARTLQRIKTLEAALNNRRSALATAQEALDSARVVANTTSDVAAIQRASAALQHALSDGPTATDVQAVLDTASELQADAKDVTDAMSPAKESTIGGEEGGFDEDASELEAELMGLMGRQEERSNAPNRPAESAPVPTPSVAAVPPLPPATASAPPATTHLSAPASPATAPSADAANALLADRLPTAPSHPPQLTPPSFKDSATTTEMPSASGQEEKDDVEALDRELESLALA